MAAGTVIFGAFLFCTLGKDANSAHAGWTEWNLNMLTCKVCSQHANKAGGTIGLERSHLQLPVSCQIVSGVCFRQPEGIETTWFPGLAELTRQGWRTTRAPAFTENLRYFSPGEREPGEGECRPEEGGEAAERGGQVPRLCAEQPRASVHGTHPPEPRTPVPYSPRQLPPPAHHHTTLPALTCPAAERRPTDEWPQLTERLTGDMWLKVHRTGATGQTDQHRIQTATGRNVFILSLFKKNWALSDWYIWT